jgi:hypothetical protein
MYFVFGVVVVNGGADQFGEVAGGEIEAGALRECDGNVDLFGREFLLKFDC